MAKKSTDGMYHLRAKSGRYDAGTEITVGPNMIREFPMEEWDVIGSPNGTDGGLTSDMKRNAEYAAGLPEQLQAMSSGAGSFPADTTTVELEPQNRVPLAQPQVARTIAQFSDAGIPDIQRQDDGSWSNYQNPGEAAWADPMAYLQDMAGNWGIPGTYTGNTTEVPLSSTNALTTLDADLGEIPNIPQIFLPENPQMRPTFSPEFDRQYQENMSGQANDLAKFYQWGDWPTMQASQMDMAGIPQPTAQTPGSNQALDFLLSGQGFSPEVMTMLRGRATDDLTRSAVSQRAGLKQALQNANMDQSGGAVAGMAQINRRLGDNVARSMMGLEVENAVRGLENQRLAAPMELQRQTTSAGMANDMALANAARVFSGMQQNVANTQQANQQNTANQQQREMTRAGAQAETQGDMARAYSQAMLNRGNTADEFNATNAINRNLNQAQLDRQRDIYNVGTGENRYGQAFNALYGMANGANPLGYSTAAGNIGAQQSANLFPAQTMMNIGNQSLQAAQRYGTGR